jgi:uncharacterized damage-inducible protein DinB
VSVFTNPASASAEQAEAYTRALIELLDDREPLRVLRGTPAAVRDAVAGLSEAQLSAPEAEGKWSVRHVVRHLADSDLVWSNRLRFVLAHDRPTLVGYDQDAWARRLRYAEADLAYALEELAVVRRGNLALLREVSDEEMERVGLHEERGEESLAHMLKLYAGHDLLHLRQIERTKAAVLNGDG